MGAQTSANDESLIRLYIPDSSQSLQEMLLPRAAHCLTPEQTETVPRFRRTRDFDFPILLADVRSLVGS
jgi:hypothetical protein